MSDLADYGWKAAGLILAGVGAISWAILYVLHRLDALDAKIDTTASDLRKEIRDGDAALRQEFQGAISDMRKENTVAFGQMFAKLDETNGNLTDHRVSVAKMVAEFMPRAELKAELMALRHPDAAE